MTRLNWDAIRFINKKKQSINEEIDFMNNDRASRFLDKAQSREDRQNKRTNPRANVAKPREATERVMRSRSGPPLRKR